MTTGGACGIGITCRQLVSNQTLPSAAASAPALRTCAITWRRQWDQALIGGTNATNRPQHRHPGQQQDVILKSTATSTSQQITAVIQRGNLLINAAVSLPASRATRIRRTPPCSISVGCYSVDGRDYRNSDTWSPTNVPTGGGSPEVRDDRGHERDRDHGPERVRTTRKSESTSAASDDGDGFCAPTTDGVGGTAARAATRSPTTPP